MEHASDTKILEVKMGGLEVMKQIQGQSPTIRMGSKILLNTQDH